MRTLTAAESAVLAAQHYRVSGRIRVANGSGSLIDLSSHFGVNWVQRIAYEEDIDEPVAKVVIDLRRDVIRPGGGRDSVLSLSPLRTDSVLNRLNDGVTYSPLLDVSRAIHVDVATTESWRAPGAADWKTLLIGTIESIAWDREPLTIVAADQGKLLVDRWIEQDNARFGSDAGVAMETVMQQLLDAWLDAPQPVLYTPASPSFLIAPQQALPAQPVLQALRTIAELIGWDVRYRWDSGTSAFRLTLQQPPRAKTTPDRTFGPSRILAVERLLIDREGIRNAVRVSYGPAVHPRLNEPAIDTTSITKYGRRWINLPELEDSPINTAAEALALANAVLADLKDPKADQEVEIPFFWPAEIWDLYRFSANGIHYNTDQDLAVTTVRHELARDRHRTTLSVRGKPAGQYLLWHRRGTGSFPVATDYAQKQSAQRAIEVADVDGRVKATLTSAVKQLGAGASLRRLSKGHIAGSGKNGDVIVFPENFQATPLVIVPDGGISYEPRSGQWSPSFNSALPQYAQRQAINVSVSGFTLRGRLVQKGTGTNRSHNFPASNNLDTVGETTALTLSNAPSSDDQYTAHYSVSLTVTNSGPAAGAITDAELVVAIDVDTGTGWDQQTQRTYYESDVFGTGSTVFSLAHDPVPVAVSGVVSTDQIRIRIVSLTLNHTPGSTGSATFSVHGFDGTGDPDSGVTYVTATDSFASMTPDAQDFLNWRAMEVDA